MERVRLTLRQSLVKFGNPYGDDANFLMLALNTAWKSRQLLDTTKIDPLVIANIDAHIKTLVEHLIEHEQVRPWTFDRINGYSWKNYGNTKEDWEGRWTYLVR